MVLLCAVKGKLALSMSTARVDASNVQRKLQEPVVACALGKLYNKDSIIEYLLDKSAYGDGKTICGHIRSLKVCSSAYIELT